MAVRVLLKTNLRNSFSVLLIGLALCDAHFLALAILIFGLPKASDWFSTISIYMSPFCNGLIGIARTGSVYLTMSVTLERYFAIVRPLHHFYAKKYLLPASLTFAILYNIPKFLELKQAVFPFTNETMIVATSLRENRIYQTVYVFWLKVIFMELIPYLVIIILNTLIVTKIRKSKKFRKSIRQQQVSNNSNSLRFHRPKKMEELQMDETQSSIPKPKQLLSKRVESSPNSRNFLRMASQNPAPTAQPYSRQEQEISLAITLVFVSILFISCQSLKIIPDLYELFCQKDDSSNMKCYSTPFIDTIVSLSNVLTCFNSAANFLVYMLRGKKFRDAFLETYGCRGKPTNDHLATASSLTAITVVQKNRLSKKYSNDTLSSSSNEPEMSN
nr:G-protein coupled receptor daf-37-like [Lepeophtheirus salmonis]